MSDGTRKKKLKLTMSSKNGSPQGSRAGSPDLANGTKPAQGASRAASPGTSLPSFLSSHYPTHTPAIPTNQPPRPSPSPNSISQLTNPPPPHRSLPPRTTHRPLPHRRRSPLPDPPHGHHGRRTARLLQGRGRDAGAEDALHGAHAAVFAVRQDDEEADACGSVTGQGGAARGRVSTAEARRGAEGAENAFWRVGNGGRRMPVVL